MVSDYARMPIPGTYWATRCTSTGVQIVIIRARKWWQVWKPRQWQEVLASAPHALRVNDTVSLSLIGDSVFLTINGDLVLRYPKEESHG